jgi:cytidylate kinase
MSLGRRRDDMAIPVITISREYGSGGRAIGERLAKELDIPFYNKELILMSAKESGLSEEYIKKTEQMKSTSFLYGLYMGAQQLPMNDQIFLIQSKIIRRVAEEGPCVIVGRCADYVLRERKDLLSVFIHAPIEYRAQRAKEKYEKSANNMVDFVKKKDKQRASFYNYFSQNKWGDARHYHLAISSTYGVDYAVEVLKHAAEAFPSGAQ